jgi:hypothetical protein
MTNSLWWKVRCSVLYLCFQLILISTSGSVLTMYEKSTGKGAKHAWTSSSSSIGALSYLIVQCYQHTRNRQFRPMECVATRTTRFKHLPSAAFLCIIPQNSVRRSSSGRFMELQPGPFCDIFNTVLSEKVAVLAAVRSLLRPSRKHRLDTDVFEEAEE